jgi:Tol biopolymer transport system component
VWFDRSGKLIDRLGAADSADARDPWMSPDSSRIALRRITSGDTDIWFLDTKRGLLDRVTSDGAGNGFPVWAPDGTQIVFSKAVSGRSHLYRKSIGRAGNEELLLAAAGTNNPSDWSRDGHFLLVRHTDAGSLPDIWALPIAGDRKPLPVVQTNFQERDAQFSPDGKWIAYQSDESGQFEIYVQRFPEGGGKERTSTTGGAQVRWRADGTELFYVALDDRLMAVPIKFISNGQTVEPGSPAQLFMTRIGGAVQGVARQQYMVSSDGQRFLMNTVSDDVTASITVILNWKGNPELTSSS